MVEKPEVGSRLDLENRLMSTISQMDIRSLELLNSLVDDELRVLSLEGVHSRDEAYIGFLRQQLISPEIAYIAALQWDNLNSSNTREAFALELNRKK